MKKPMKRKKNTRMSRLRKGKRMMLSRKRSSSSLGTERRKRTKKIALTGSLQLRGTLRAKIH